MRRLPLVAAILLMLPACATGDSSNAIAADLDEWSIELSADRFEAGPVTIDVHNIGEFPHTLVVEGADGAVIAATDVVAPGQATLLEIDLGNEAYRFTCRIVATGSDGSVVDHFEEGMVASVSPG